MIKDNHKIVSVEGTSQNDLPLKQSVRTRVKTWNEEPSMTQQQFKDETDINNIMRKHGADPVAFQALTRKGGVYADFSNLKDYQSMLQDVANAQDAFASLPALTRARFQNNPGELISFIQNPNNYDEAVTLGLIEPKPTPQHSPTSKNELNDKTEGDPPSLKTSKQPKS